MEGDIAFGILLIGLDLSRVNDIHGVREAVVGETYTIGGPACRIIVWLPSTERSLGFTVHMDKAEGLSLQRRISAGPTTLTAAILVIQDERLL